MTETNSLPATTGLSPWGAVKKFVARDQATYLLFKKGDWMCGDDEVSAKQYRVDPLEIYYGYQYWKDSTPGEVQMVRIDQLHLHPRRSDLGDTDQDLWPVVDGKPKDPYARTVRMGLIDPETDAMVFFTSSSHGGRDAVNEFCSNYEKDRHRFADQLPIVCLDTETYKHKIYGKVLKPKFTIVRWETADGSEPTPVDQKKQITEAVGGDALPDFPEA